MKNKLILCAICLGITGLAGCSSANGEAAQSTADSVVAEVDNSIVFDGTVTAKEEKVIFAKESGKIKDILFEEGDRIQDEVVMHYTIPDLTEEKTEEDEEDEKERVKVKNIRSDFSDAIVTEIEVTEGQSIIEGTPLMKISKENDYFILAEVLENFINDIEPDSKVTIIPNSDKSKNYEGTVTKIYPMAFQNENEDNVVKVEIALDKQEESLHLGYTVKIKVK